MEKVNSTLPGQHIHEDRSPNQISMLALGYPAGAHTEIQCSPPIKGRHVHIRNHNISKLSDWTRVGSSLGRQEKKDFDWLTVGDSLSLSSAIRNESKTEERERERISISIQFLSLVF